MLREELVNDCGVVKIADFGLSRTLPTKGNKHAEAMFDKDDTYVLTGECGSVSF